MTRQAFIPRLARDKRGTMAIETALIAPLLATMALGTFEVSQMVSRQQELQSAANEATEVILAAAGGSGVSSSDLEDILEATLGLPDGNLTLTQVFRCDAATSTTNDKTTCDQSQPIYEYAVLSITDTYTPAWTHFGIGSPVNYNVVRTVQIS